MKFIGQKAKKGILAAAACAFAVLPLAGCGGETIPATPAPAQKIAVVDYHELLQNHPSRKAAEEEMQKSYQEFQKKAGELKTDSGESQEDQMKAYSKLQEEVMNKQDALFKPVKDGVDKSLDEVMKEKGYTAVFSRDALIRGGEDITIEVLRKEGASEDDIKAVENRMAPASN